jgi:hypothetical protein
LSSPEEELLASVAETLERAKYLWISEARSSAMSTLYEEAETNPVMQSVVEVAKALCKQLPELSGGVSNADMSASLCAVGVLLCSTEIRERFVDLSAESLIMLFSDLLAHSDS